MDHMGYVLEWEYRYSILGQSFGASCQVAHVN